MTRGRAPAPRREPREPCCRRDDSAEAELWSLLTLDHQSSDRRASHSGPGTVGGANVDAGVLKGGV